MASSHPVLQMDALEKSGNYNHLRLITMGRSSRASIGVDTIILTANNDYSNDYDHIDIYALHTSYNTTLQNSTTGIWGGICAGGSSVANCIGSATCDIPCYAQSTYFKSFISEIGVSPEANNGSQAGNSWGQWRNTGAITSLQVNLQSNLFSSAGCVFQTGSAFYLYAL